MEFDHATSVPFFFFPVLFYVRCAPGGEVDVLGSGEDDEAVPDPADGEVGRLPVRLVSAHNSASGGEIRNHVLQ